jgi:hypothetical protein
MHSLKSLLRWICILCTAAAALNAQAAGPIVLADITGKCSDPFSLKKDGSACEINEEKLKKLNEAITKDPSKAERLCVGPALQLTGTVCSAVDGKAPTPDCGNSLPDLAFVGGRCVVDQKIPRSSSGDYVGDCFRIDALVEGKPLGYPAGSALRVLSQQSVGANDRLLSVASIKLEKPTHRWHCTGTLDPVVKTIHASDLIEIGARRTGWAYGALAMPYKYYSHNRSFGSGVSVGPYMGWRRGAPGSAYTWAAAATIGSVKGTVRDATGAIAETPDLQAFSLAVGTMFDVAKSEGAKAFKIGLFVGADWVSAGNIVKYANNRKPWLAFQIGYDFTDN